MGRSLRLRVCRVRLVRATRWLIKQKARRQEDESSLRQNVCTRFQALFHSPLGVLFTFPSWYCALSVIRSYLALEGGPPVFRQDFTCPALLFDGRQFLARYRPVTCCGGAFHPASLAIRCTLPVWAPPGSLTTTAGISVDFFSSGY